MAKGKSGRAATGDGELDLSGSDDLFSEVEGGLDLGDAPDPDSVDPIGEVDYPGTIDGDTRAELAALSKAFKDRAAAEKARFEAATDSEYWFAVPFETRQQKEAFLRAMGWLKFGDKYLDGVLLAQEQGIPLPPAHTPYVTSKPDAKLSAISLPLDG